MEKEENLPTPENEDPVESDASEAEQTDEQTDEEKDASVDRPKSKLDDAYGKQDDLKSKYLRAVQLGKPRNARFATGGRRLKDKVAMISDLFRY